MWYEVNSDNVIVALSPNWDYTAVTASNPKLLSRNLIGKPLSDFISGDVTSMFTETMISSARVQQKTLLKAYRCDTPTHKREMQMTLMPLPHGDVRVTHETLTETPWQHPRKMHTVTPHQRLAKIKRCSMCNNLLDGKDWITQDVYLSHHPEATAESLAVFYGICPHCAKRSKRTASE